jgi:hypothetical protein
VDEREDGVERLRHEGRVHRWSRRSPAWPGHTTFVALKGGEAVLGDRYAGEGVERTYACDLRSLLDGCFHSVIGEQLGARVLEELLTEARRELGEATTQAAGTKNAREAAGAERAGAERATTERAGAERATTERATGETSSKAQKKPSAAGSGANAPASAPAPAKVVSAPVEPVRIATEPSERPSTGSTGVPEPGSPCELTVVACRSVSLPLAVALRGITRAPVQELLAKLRSLPCRIAAGVPREQAEALATRLSELGAEVLLAPARAS